MVARGEAPTWMYPLRSSPAAFGSRVQHQAYDVISDLVVHVDSVDHAAGANDLLAGNHRLHAERRFAGGHGVENCPLFDAVWIADDYFHHKSVHLRFGQRISAFLLQRILRGEHEETIGSS